MKGQDTVSVMTHNVLAFSGHPKELHHLDTNIFNRAIRFYREKNPDILVLQECPPERYVSKLADSLGYHYRYFKTGWTGNEVFPYGFPGSVLCKYPIKKAFDFQLNRGQVADSLFQRHLGFVKIPFRDKNISLGAMHLCANYDGRFRENTRLNEIDIMFRNFKRFNKEHNADIFILAGDFNSTPQSLPFCEIVQRGYKDIYSKQPMSTVPVPDPSVQIDFVFVKTKERYKIVNIPLHLPYWNDNELFLSDHIPVFLLVVVD